VRSIEFNMFRPQTGQTYMIYLVTFWYLLMMVKKKASMGFYIEPYRVLDTI